VQAAEKSNLPPMRRPMDAQTAQAGPRFLAYSLLIGGMDINSLYPKNKTDKKKQVVKKPNSFGL